jgi:UDP-GlcNAc3NAcA epimerase
MIILTIVGARPQFIKAAAVSRAIRRSHREVLIHTGQHYDANMSDAFFGELDLPEPDEHLGIGSGSHAEQTGRMLPAIASAIERHRPDVVLVYGDTNSTLAGALAAAKLAVPIAHVEAGLRSFNRRMAEEINRIVTDRLSQFLFCPSHTAVANLRSEGITTGVHLVGDVMADVLRLTVSNGHQPSALAGDLCLEPSRYVLATIHRAENADDGQRLSALVGSLGCTNEPVVLPLHPRTRKALERERIALPANVRAIDPIGYVDLLALAKSARLVVTDSGGLQKEAYWLHVPCVTLRDETEWVETVEAGWNRLVGADPGRIRAAMSPDVEWPSAHPPLYGDGHAAERIVDVFDGL